MLLAERLRDDSEKEVVKAVLEKKMKTTVDVESLYHVRMEGGRRGRRGT